MLELKHGETTIETVAPNSYVLIPDLGHIVAVEGWTNGTYSLVEKQPDPPPVEPEKTLAEWAAHYRWQKETGGVDVGGVPILTDDRSKLLITGLRLAANSDPEYTARFKMTNGSFAELDAISITAISNAVAAHVTACFDLEVDAIEGITAGTITTREQVEAAFFP